MQLYSICCTYVPGGRLALEIYLKVWWNTRKLTALASFYSLSPSNVIYSLAVKSAVLVSTKQRFVDCSDVNASFLKDFLSKGNSQAPLWKRQVIKSRLKWHSLQSNIWSLILKTLEHQSNQLSCIVDWRSKIILNPSSFSVLKQVVHQGNLWLTEPGEVAAVTFLIFKWIKL